MKNLTLILFTLCINFNTFSQTSIGIKTGLNLSQAKYLNEAIYHPSVSGRKIIPIPIKDMEDPEKVAGKVFQIAWDTLL